jgi:hypothetical protein
MKFQLRQGKRYEAVITLGWLEKFASNELLQGKLRAAGFSNVTVMGTGSTRHAEGTWGEPDQEVDLPSQVSGVKEETS